MTNKIIYPINVLFNSFAERGGGGGFWHPKDRLKVSLKELGCFICPKGKFLSMSLENILMLELYLYTTFLLSLF